MLDEAKERKAAESALSSLDVGSKIMLSSLSRDEVYISGWLARARRREAGEVCERCLKPASDTIHGPHSECWGCDEPKAHHRFGSHLPPLEHDASRAGQDREGA